METRAKITTAGKTINIDIHTTSSTLITFVYITQKHNSIGKRVQHQCLYIKRNNSKSVLHQSKNTYQ